MLNLMLISLSTAFLLALFSGVSQLLSMFVNPVLVNTSFVLVFSVATSFLVTVPGWRAHIVYIMAGAFLGRTFLTIAEKVANFHATIVRNTQV